MPCILGKHRLPADLVRSAVENASRPQAFSSYNYRKVLEIACALIHKRYADEKKEDWKIMSLDRNRDKRDYLYGRLVETQLSDGTIFIR